MNMNVEMITTGDEIITGYIADTNAAYLGQILLDKGIKLSRITTVGDSLNDITSVLKERGEKADYIIVNGGLGPTSDDLTAEAAAKAINKELTYRTDWEEKLKQWFQAKNITMSEINKKQCFIPEGADVINNSCGTACGFKMKIGKATCFFTPGVPSEFKAMLKDEIIPDIDKELNITQKEHVKRYFIFGIGESAIGEKLQQEKWSNEITIGYRVFYPFIEIKIISHNALNTDWDNLDTKIRTYLSNYLIGVDNFTLWEDLENYLAGKIISVSDEATNGLLLEKFSNFDKTQVLYSNLALSLDEKLNNDIKILLEHPSGTLLKITIANINKENKFCKTFDLHRKGKDLSILATALTANIMCRIFMGENPSVQYESISDATL